MEDEIGIIWSKTEGLILKEWYKIIINGIR